MSDSGYRFKRILKLKQKNKNIPKIKNRGVQNGKRQRLYKTI